MLYPNATLYFESIDKLEMIEAGPNIPYIDLNNKEHIYFIDFKLKNTNIVFEIKSDYYWNKNLEINLIKKETATKLYRYYLILNNDFSVIKTILDEEI